MTPLEIMARSHCKGEIGGFCRNIGGSKGCKNGRGQNDYKRCVATEGQLMLSGATDAAKAALQALNDAGWVVVPKEATDAMVDRFVSRALQVSVANEGGWSAYGRNQYKAMIEAGAYKV